MIFAIDPGWTGAVVTLSRNEDGKRKTTVYRMPETDVGIVTMVKKIAEFPNVRAYLERVHNMPGDGGSSIWKFASNYVAWKTALLYAGVRHTLVDPQRWQAEFQLCEPGLSALRKINRRAYEKAKAEKKRRHKEEAQRQFAKLKVTLLNCDALLIALYADRNSATMRP